MKFEFANNADAGIYLKELAGTPASELNTTDFAHSMIVFDEYAETLPTGAVNYAYAIPSASLSPLYTGDGTLNVSVKDGDGNAVAVENNCFKPTKSGTHTIIYATTFAGKKVTLERTVTVLEAPAPITVACEPFSVGYYEYLRMPEVRVNGGSGALSVEKKFVKGETEISLARNGKYLIDGTQDV